MFLLRASSALVTLLLVLGAGAASAQAADGDQSVLVRFAPSADAGDRAAARRVAGAAFEQSLPLTGLQVVDPKTGRTTGEVVDGLEASDDVLYAEPDAPRAALAFPDDQFAYLEWGLRNTGQSVNGTTGTAAADIEASDAWDLTTGDPAVTVGVLDSGIDLDHPDLSPNLWTNPGESGALATNGLDDDDNGYVDDTHGWDWVSADDDPADEYWHGTHVAGTIGARGNDGTGVAGVAWNVGLVPLRVLDSTGSGHVSDLISAYGYARENGIRIVNASLGGAPGSLAEYQAILAASDTLFVVAAGNAGSDNDVSGTYPCAYDLPNIICVAATDQNDALAGFSNYGAATVDLAAPGVNIASTVPDDAWALADGTSMATPHVSGAAALVWARFPDATVTGVRAALLSSVEPKPSLAGKTVTGGRLNAFRALGGIPVVPATSPSTGSSKAKPPDTPTVVATLPARDTRAPRVVVVLRGKLRLRLGVRVRTRCSEACSVRHELLIRRAPALVVGRARGHLGGAGAVTVRLKLTAAARHRLRRTHSIRLELRTRAVDRAGNERTVKRLVRLYRR